jgi:hypothetical protein
MNSTIAKKILVDSANYFKNNSIVMQFIPIVIILFYSSFRYDFNRIGHSILGKLFAVMLILYYTRMDWIYGVICCIVVIFYYQQTETEGFDEELPKTESKSKTNTNDVKKKDEEVEDGTNLPDINEGFTGVISTEQFNIAKDQFIKEKCKNGVLMYKDFPVKTEMADHVYSEIEFPDKTKCNPCDRTCNYNIIEAKMTTEKKLISKNSNDLFDAFKKFFGKSESFVPYEGNAFPQMKSFYSL